MEERNVASTQLPLYDIVPDPKGIANLIQHLRSRKIDMICFTSALTFTSVAEQLTPGELKELMAPVALAAIGPITAEAIRQGGLAAALQPASASAEALATAMVDWFKTHQDFRRDG
jgi:uroporphyrinogen III methyltransferase/synthase